ncbi:MAG: hypothetical protein IKS49_05195 [Actinomycetaceae bacterium]|nr:hypothetical protein [Actinomycetaceae bacterium]
MQPSPPKRYRSRRFGSIMLPPVDPDAHPPTARRLTVVPEPGPLSYAPLSQIIGEIDIATMYTPIETKPNTTTH